MFSLLYGKLGDGGVRCRGEKEGGTNYVCVLHLLKVSARILLRVKVYNICCVFGELKHLLVTLPVASLGCRSEANDLALRLALHHTKNTEILTLDR